MVNKKIVLAALLVIAAVFMCGCTSDGGTDTPTATTVAPTETTPVATPEFLKIATTTSLDNTGLLEDLKDRFEKDHDVTLQIIAAGTGKALEYGERGDVDVLMVHDRAREDLFMDNGYGINRRVFAYNYFMIVGPESDPAGIAGMTPEDAFVTIMEQAQTNPDVVMVSRGDSSGTHAKEKAIWASAGYDYDTEVVGSGEWYVEGGQGMGATLQMANEFQAYTVSDSGTYLAYKGDIDLVPVVDEGDVLLNIYGAMMINPEKYSYVNSEMAKEWINFLITPETQQVIAEFGVEEYGQPLFFPSLGNYEILGVSQEEAESPIP
ncbi:tungsten ABC transporter substrate-binding protein [Methanomicrobiaceae archaeon CYW5]|uniref:substrate-binding domain-containing protein n=1 Tax=Methanovulcanius yangii TaxID=1789227 RepID=UPI0029CA9F15|nr:substrate-binding domain-containing protein [Methanovulcanius yangii]MBT8507720.1 tungsten ABC transporter substrate-binding protein [Methanovulcanius yangii]